MIDSGGEVSLANAYRISAPLLMMLDEQDKLNPREYGQKFAERAANGRVVMFPTPHAVHDHDWEGFQRVVGEFLDAIR